MSSKLSWKYKDFPYTSCLSTSASLTVNMPQKIWNSNTLATWCEELTHLERPWCWERLRAGEGDDRGWDGWLASPTQWTWVWVDSGSWWWTWRPGMLRSMGLKELDTTEWLNWTELTATDEPALTNHHWKSIAYIRVHLVLYDLCVWTNISHELTITESFRIESLP